VIVSQERQENFSRTCWITFHWRGMSSRVIEVLRRPDATKPPTTASHIRRASRGSLRLHREGLAPHGFTAIEYGTSAKWLELLKQIAPRVMRAVVIRHPVLTSGIAQFAAIQTVAPAHGVDLIPVDVRDVTRIEQAIIALTREPNDGLIVTSTGASVHRTLIIDLATRHRLPAVYPYRYYASGGGLISYGPDTVDQYRRAAGYVDRILRGEKPADLPVQAPTKYELVINLKTAKALGFDVPPTLLARADEVIE
jgi:putative ABC transport system substrate-binding protein